MWQLEQKYNIGKKGKTTETSEIIVKKFMIDVDGNPKRTSTDSRQQIDLSFEVYMIKTLIPCCKKNDDVYLVTGSDR